MPFFLLNNPEISSCKWVVFVPDEPKHPHYTAELRIFKSDQQAREDCADHEGLLILGKPWVLRFAGVANSPRLPVSLDYEQSIDSFMNEAAGWAEKITL